MWYALERALCVNVTQLCDLIDERKQELFDLLSSLIRINSENFGAGREFGEEGGTHQPNEYIVCDKLAEYVKIIGAYILRTEG